MEKNNKRRRRKRTGCGWPRDSPHPGLFWRLIGRIPSYSNYLHDDNNENAAAAAAAIPGVSWLATTIFTHFHSARCLVTGFFKLISFDYRFRITPSFFGVNWFLLVFVRLLINSALDWCATQHLVAKLTNPLLAVSFVSADSNSRHWESRVVSPRESCVANPTLLVWKEPLMNTTRKPSCQDVAVITSRDLLDIHHQKHQLVGSNPIRRWSILVNSTYFQIPFNAAPRAIFGRSNYRHLTSLLLPPSSSTQWSILLGSDRFLLW